MAQSRSANIKQTLAYSLHEIAKILADQRLVEEELVQVFEDMIQVCFCRGAICYCILPSLRLQDTELVQMGVIKNLASFLGMLPEPCRVSYLPLLHEILHSTNPFNWRLRQYLALQLPQLILLPPKPDIFRTLFRLVMILLQDPVASVRRDSFKGVTALIAKLYEMSEATPSDDINENLIKSSRQNLDEMCSSINSFIENDKFQLRLLWVELSYRLLLDLPKDLFEKYFLYGLVKLINDRVSNVRVAISYVLTGWDVNTAPTWSKMAKKNPVESDEERTTRKESPWNWLLNGSDIKSCIEKLAVDKNDVYLNMVKLKPRFPTIEFTSTTARGGASQRSDISIASSDVGSSKASEADDAAVVMGSDHDSLNNDDDTEEEIEPVNRNRWSTGSGHSAEYILNLSASNSPAASLDLQDIGIVIGQIEHLPSDELPVPKRKMSITERESNDDVDEEEIKNDTGAEVNTESEKADGEVPLADETATVDAEEISVDFSNEADLVLKDNIQVREPETIQVSTKEKNDTDISKEDQGNNDEKAAKEIMLEGSNNVESVDEFLDSLKMNE